MSIISELKKQGGKASAQTISEAIPDITKELPLPNPDDTGKVFGFAVNSETGKYELVDITNRISPAEEVVDNNT